MVDLASWAYWFLAKTEYRTVVAPGGSRLGTVKDWLPLCSWARAWQQSFVVSYPQLYGK